MYTIFSPVFFDSRILVMLRFFRAGLESVVVFMHDNLSGGSGSMPGDFLLKLEGWTWEFVLMYLITVQAGSSIPRP